MIGKAKALFAEIGSLGSTVEQGVRQLGASLARSPLGLTSIQIDRSIEAWSKNLETNAGDFLAATNLASWLVFPGERREASVEAALS